MKLKLDVTTGFKILNVISMFMGLAEGLKHAKGGSQKLEYVLANTSKAVTGVEDVAGVDLLNNEALRPFAEKYIAAAKELVNEVAKYKALAQGFGPDAKSLKADPAPAV